MLMSSRSLSVPALPQALLEHMLRPARQPSFSSPAWRRNEDQFDLELLAPGLAPSDVKVQVEGSTLTVNLGRQAVVQARLPAAADAAKLSATLSRGILKLSLGIQATSLPRTIEVQEIVEPVVTTVSEQ